MRRRGRSTGVSDAIATREQPAADVQFDRLYRSSRDDVYAYVATLVRDRLAAEDVTALAFERAYRSRGSFRPARGSRAGVAVRHRPQRGARRAAAPAAGPRPSRRSRRRPRSRADDPAEIGRCAARSCAARSSRSQPRERELVALKFFAGLTNAELAAVIGTSETNAGTRLHRVIEKLREACHETA